MKLRTPLFASLAIAALAVPVASVTALTLTTTPAFAKSGNNKGGNRANRGGSRKPSASRSSRGNSSNAGGNGKSQAAPARSVTAKPASAPAPASDESVELHPSQIGSMNGALHANINAVAAHIRNGNTNGPVGALAALAVARTNATGAQAVIDAAGAYAILEQDLADAVSGSEYPSLDAYLAAKQAAGDAFETDGSIESALAALAAAPPPPTDPEMVAAQTALAAETTAEEGIFAAWNKSDEATIEEQQALLTALRDRIDAESEAISDAIEAAGVSSEPDVAGETDLIDEELPEEELASQQ